jgi:alanine-synthesizing transaminase
VDLDFMREIVELARQYGSYVVHDFAYAELGFDGYRPPSILQVPGAADVAVEIYSMTKTYNMAGWRVGFCLGNRRLIAALARIKSYLDYGMFQPIQMAAVTALRDCQDAPGQIRQVYQARRDVLIEGLRRAGWRVPPPKATMFTWARIPEAFSGMPSLEFAKLLMKEARLAVSPGIGFGPLGEGFVRFSLIENDERVRQAMTRVGDFLKAREALVAAGPETVHV